MTREEILEKSRMEKSDEGMREAENRGRKIGITAFCLMEIVIILFNFFTGQSNYVPFAIFWAFSGTESYSKYRFTGQRTFLLITILGGVASVLFFVCHVLEVFM